MDKKFIKIPNKSDFEKILWCAEIAEAVSGNSVSKSTIMEAIEDKGLSLTKTQVQLIEEKFK